MDLNINWQEDKQYETGTLTGKVAEFNLFYIFKGDKCYILYSTLNAFPMRNFRNWQYQPIRHHDQDRLKKTAEGMLESLLKAAKQRKPKGQD